MKVSKLIKILEKHPDWDVLAASDSEGNSFSELNEVVQQAYAKHRGEIQLGITELTPELEKLGYGDDDVLSKGKMAFIIWP
jgi:hypothetical protein